MPGPIFNRRMAGSQKDVRSRGRGLLSRVRRWLFVRDYYFNFFPVAAQIDFRFPGLQTLDQVISVP